MFVLIHSPLVGPSTWAPVAEELRRRGPDAVLPALESVDEPDAPPYWQQHALSAARAIAAMPPGERPLLVAHSGAGLLLPAVRQTAGRPAAGYIFVDAGIPEDGKSRLDLLAAEMGEEWAGGVRRELEGGARLPQWTDDDLREEIPDARLRAELLAELHPRPIAFYEEPIPVFPGWPDAPCAYLQFTGSYDRPAARARAAGWPFLQRAAGHFHMLVDPAWVADALVTLLDQMSTST